MTIDEIILFVGIFLTITLGWFSVVLLIPGYTESILRYRLWRVRDQVYDDIASGKLPDCRASRNLIDEVETLIRASHHMTLPRILLLWVACPRQTNNVTQPSHDLYTNEQIEYAKQIHDGAYELCARHAIFGTYSGWFAIPFLVTIGVVMRIFHLYQQTKKFGFYMLECLAKESVRNEEKKHSQTARLAGL